MGDIRDLGATGQAVFANAERLQKAKVIDDTQFKELTNDKVGPQDVAIGNAALNKLMGVQAGDKEGVSLFMSIPKMNGDIMKLQAQALKKTVEEARPAPTPEVRDGLRNFMDHIANTPPSNIQPIAR